MTTRANEVIERCIQDDEGGWVFTDRADDAGGPTYGGMTWRTFGEWLEGTTRYTRDDFIADAIDHDENLRKDILQCYYDEFWLKGNVSYVPQFAQQMYFSACVNMGVKTALKCLQMAVNKYEGEHLTVDGHWGPITDEAIQETGQFVLASEDYLEELKFKTDFSDAVMERYIRFVQSNARAWREAYNNKMKTPPRVLQSENLMGWFNRARSYRSK